MNRKHKSELQWPNAREHALSRAVEQVSMHGTSIVDDRVAMWPLECPNQLRFNSAMHMARALQTLYCEPIVNL